MSKEILLLPLIDSSFLSKRSLALSVFENWSLSNVYEELMHMTMKATKKITTTKRAFIIFTFIPRDLKVLRIAFHEGRR